MIIKSTENHFPGSRRQEFWLISEMTTPTVFLVRWISYWVQITSAVIVISMSFAISVTVSVIVPIVISNGGVENTNGQKRKDEYKDKRLDYSHHYLSPFGRHHGAPAEAKEAHFSHFTLAAT
jgi:hypothetical protein